MNTLKKIISMLTIASLLLFTIGPAYAETKTFTSSSSEWWAPNSGQIDRSYSDVMEMDINNCYYSSDKITRIRQEYINNIAIGLDMHDYNKDHLLPNASRGSNYPNPHFDLDDDDGDGYNDESEVSCGTPSQLSSSSRYYFWQNWAKFTQTGTGTLTNNAIASIMGAGEWQTYRYKSLPPFTYDCSNIVPPDGASLQKDVMYQEQDDTGKTVVTKKPKYYKIKYFPKFEDREILNRYIEDNNKEIEEVSKQVDGDIPVTITFKESISKERVQELIDKHALRVDTVTCRAVDSRGDRVTAETDVFENRIDLEQMLKSIYNKDPKTDFKGIFSIRGSMNPTFIKDLSDEPDVFLVDISYLSLAAKYREKVNLADDIQVKVYIASPFWYIENN